MVYTVKEIYYTLQGEGMHAGRPAVICRFSGCNLWSGREQDRANAICRFCDTDFVGADGENGGKYYSPEELARMCREVFGGVCVEPFIILTGGEPMQQVDEALVRALHDQGFYIAIETNGTLHVPESIDWICVSPKAGTMLAQRAGNELKLIYPQPGLEPLDLAGLEFDHFYLQPMDASPVFHEEEQAAAASEANMAAALSHCLQYPKWRLSIQNHKLLGLP